jgi:hypothetical protein
MFFDTAIVATLKLKEQTSKETTDESCGLGVSELNLEPTKKQKNLIKNFIQYNRQKKLRRSL